MRHELKLYCNTDQLSGLRAFLNEILVKTSLPEIEQHQVMLAVDEVCANLIIHSHGCNPHHQISVQVLTQEAGLVIEISDSGESFNLLDYQEPELLEVKKTKRKGGLGIILVKKIMDKIEFESSGKLNTCRLFKNLKSK
jgi:serine/threonine-protein kinase RsbW